MSRVRAFVPMSWLVALAAPAALAQQRPYDGVLPADAPVSVGDETWQAFRVVDAVTGKPIAGAELLLVDEARTPVSGKMWSQRVAKSDADGFVAVRSDDVKRFAWMILRAPGYGVASAERVVPSLVWPLSPAVEVPVQLCDWLGRPVADAQLGWCVGCGHTPDVINVRTDAKGLARIAGVDANNAVADVYAEAPSLCIADYSRVDWVPGAPPAILRASPGFAVRGKVLLVDGKPAAGAFVGVEEVHRGPWSEVGADGTFELFGAASEGDLVVMVGRQKVLFERPDGEQPFTLQLPELPKSDGKDEDEDEPEDDGGAEVSGQDHRPTGERRPPRTLVVNLPGLPEGKTTPVAVKVVEVGGGAVDELLLGILGPLPRHVLREEEVHGGKAEFERLPGSYEVVCLTEGYERAVGRLEVGADKSVDAALQVRPLAKQKVRVPDFGSIDSVYLRTARGSQEITSLFGEDGTAIVRVPNDEPFELAVSNTIGRRLLVGQKGAAEIVLQACTPTHVVGQVVGPDGAPVAATVAIVGRWDCLRDVAQFDPRRVDGTSVDTGAFDLATPAAGLSFLAVVPASASLRPRLVPAILPLPGVDGRVDLGKVALRAEAELRVLDGEGHPMADTPIGFTRVGWHDVRERGPAFVTDDQGGWMGPDLVAGDSITVPAAAWDIEQEASEGEQAVVDVPVRMVLQGAGPWRVRVPAGQLLIDVKREDGNPVRARVFVGDRSVMVSGPTLLRQLPPGKLQLKIAAPECKPVVVDTEVPANGKGELQIKL